ncbi:immunity 22 family protein [Undibacterium pigrum]|uniref:Immunity protein 22 of polymorphic toxin system n=1 Tax=Undibacterium pigrum TaxID=401470 RepID=A0A318JLP4_9BURK|nr:immunity 22 family protein [Undibacterium pigrum]PXX44841.1 immunity protein 22 of polymorphic toxin system [Undibacterium pigrum]
MDLLKDLCGVDFCDLDFQECIPALEKTDAIGNLVNQLSYNKSFGSNACSSAQAIGINEIAWVVMQLNFSFDDSQTKKKVSDIVRFLGVFNYDDDD